MNAKQYGIVVSWSVLISSVLLYSVLMSPPPILSYILLGLASFFAGVVLVDLDVIIVGCLITFALCVAMMFIALSLPVFLGTLSHAVLSDLVYTQALRMIFYATFPISIILCLVTGILGGYVGEKVFPNVL